MTNTDTAATLSYTITNTGPVPANNFSVRCIGSRRPRFNSYIPSLGAEGIIGSGWAVDTSLCNNINLAANNGSCTITVTNTNLTTGSNNFTPSCTMSWDDEDSPNGEQQLISQSTVYVSMSL